MHKTLLANSFRRTCSDAGVYVHDQWEIILIVYVNDLLPMGPRLDRITLIKKILVKQFQMQDLGAATTFLGMRIECDQKNRILWINQKAYTEGIVLRFDIMNAKPLQTPLLEGIHLEKASDDYTAKDKFQTNYQAMIGSLIYLMIGSRPDIAWSVTCLSQYMQNPTQLHVNACKHIFRYLQGTLDARITYDGGKNSGLIGYSDADWGENRDNRQSTTGYVFLMADGAVTWALQMQKTVAQSSMEAEYMALSEVRSEIAWLTTLQWEIGYGSKGPVPLVADNQGGIFLAVNPAHDRQLKHIDIRYHFICEYIEEGCVNIVYVSTDKMIADTLTKPLGTTKFEEFRSQLGITIGKS